MLGIFKALFSKNDEKPESVKTPGQEKSADTVGLTKAEPVMTEQQTQRQTEQKTEQQTGQQTQQKKPAKSPNEEGQKKARQKARQKPQNQDDPARDLYRYLNQAVKTMHTYYSKGQFGELTHLGKIPGRVLEGYDSIMEKLSEDSAAYLSTLRAMILLKKEGDSNHAMIADQEGLEKEFLGSMLPFYALYAGELYKGKVRFSSLIGKDMLKLFHELTGKKFSIGFHRRYESGINAFEWDQDVWQVFDEKGHMLCDADFVDGRVNNGYAEIAEPDPDYEDWNIVKAGHFINGEFRDGALRYVYRHPIN